MAMYRVIAILLATTCRVHSNKPIPYPAYIPVEYHPQEYDYVYLPVDSPYSDLYSSSFTRTDENFQPDTEVSVQEIILDDVPPSSSDPLETKSQKPEITTPSALKLQSKDEVIYEFETNDLSSVKESSQIPLDIAPLSNTKQPKQQAKEEPKYQNDISPSTNNDKEQAKYSNDNNYSPNNPSDNKYPSTNLAPFPKNYKEKSKYLNDNNYSLNNSPDNKYPSNDLSPSPKKYKEQPKYSNDNNYSPNNPSDNKYPSNNLAPFPKNYKEKSKYLNDNNYSLNNSPDNKYPSNDLSPSLNNYKDQHKYTNNNNFSPKNAPDNKYPSKSLAPTPKNYKDKSKYLNDNKYSSNNPRDNKYSLNGLPLSLNNYKDQQHSNDNNYLPNKPSDNKYPSNNLPSASNNYKDQLKYSNDNSSSPNSPSKKYQKTPKYQEEYKYPYYPPKSYQERPKYEDNFNSPSITVYPSQNTNQEIPKKSASDVVYSLKPEERPKYSKQDTNTNEISSSSSSSEEQTKSSSKEEAFQSKSYQVRPLQETSIKQDQEDFNYDISPTPPEYLGPQGIEKVSSTAWYAPPFYQSLKDMQATENIILSRIFAKNPRQNDKLYTILVGVLDGMIKTMGHTLWRNYDREYDSKVPQLFKYARATRHIANSQLKCVYDWINQSINKIRTVMSNDWIKHICHISDVPCDTMVLTVVDASNDMQLQKEARLLLALGKAGRLFLNRYVKTLDRQTSVDRPTDLYSFMLESKNYFRALIKASSQAHMLLPLSTYYCYDGPKKYNRDSE